MNEFTLQKFKRDTVLYWHVYNGIKSSFALRQEALALYLGIRKSELIFHLLPGGRPFLISHPELSFSVSHSKNLWAIAIGQKNLGFDLQCSLRRNEVEEKTFYQNLMRRFPLVAKERHLYQTFIEHWVSLEARAKLSGLGIWHYLGRGGSAEAQIIKVPAATNWQAENFRAALALS